MQTRFQGLYKQKLCFQPLSCKLTYLHDCGICQFRMLLHFHTNQLDFNMLDFSLICFHHKYCFPLGSVCLDVCLSGSVSASVRRCVSLLVVHGTFMSTQLFSFFGKQKRCVHKEGELQGQNELMLNIPYWFYCNSFLIFSLFNFISLRLVGMEIRSVLFFSLSLFLPV